MYTKHGHQIPGSTVDPQRPLLVHRCGGPSICPDCQEEVAIFAESVVGLTATSFPDKARKIVFEHITTGGAHPTLTMSDVYVVWCCKTLQNWKALVSTTVVDGRYYEITYNGDKHETYLDAYIKGVNIRIPD